MLFNILCFNTPYQSTFKCNYQKGYQKYININENQAH